MKCPVRASDGYVYEESALVQYMLQCQYDNVPITSPVTKAPMERAYEKEGSLAKQIASLLDERFSVPTTASSDTGFASMLDMNDLFSALDGLNNVLVESLGEFKPPYLIAFGGESMGKSTLLQRLSLLPFFPTKKSRCTRIPIKVEIRRAAVGGPAIIRVWDSTKSSFVGKTVQIAVPTSAEDSEVYDRMMALVGSKDAVSTNLEMHIRITSATLPPINLVDLPGLVQAGDLKKQTEQIFSKYVSEPEARDIFLAVSSALTSPANWITTDLITKNKLEGRTVGVITYCDRLSIEEGEDAWLRSIITGSAPEELMKLRPHGYVAVASKNLPQQENESFSEWMNRKSQREEHLFREELQMGDLVKSNQATIHGLVQRINASYKWHVLRDWLPKTVAKLQEAWNNNCEALVKLGVPRSDGNLQGEALAKFQVAASAEAQSRLGFLIGLPGKLFWNQLGARVQKYLEDELQKLQLPGSLLGLPNFLVRSCARLCEQLPIGNSFQAGDLLSQAEQALQESRPPFHIGRLPQFKANLLGGIERNLPVFDESLARRGITEVLQEVFRPSATSTALTISVDKSGQTSLKFNLPQIVGPCLFELAKAFSGSFNTRKDLEELVIQPALCVQEQDNFATSSERTFTPTWPSVLMLSTS